MRFIPPREFELPSRRAMTLVELLLATALVGILAVGLASFARIVEIGSDYGQSRAIATQHARVALERIERAVSQAQATENNPGFAILAATHGGAIFPDTLVVWTSDANNDRLPQVQELTVFAPLAARPNELVELSLPGDSRTVALTNTTGLKATVDDMRTGANRRTVTLTDRVRTAPIPEDGGSAHAGVFFSGFLRPSAADLASFRAAATSWESLPWPQGICGGRTGLRAGYVAIELQLLVDDTQASHVRQAEEVLPFFGSATLSYQISK